MITPNKARPTKPVSGISKPQPITNALNPLISPVATTHQNLRSKSANRTPINIKETEPSEGDSEYENELIEKVLKATKDRFNAKFEPKKKSPERERKISTQLNFNKKTGLAPPPRMETQPHSDSLRLEEDPYRNLISLDMTIRTLYKVL